MRVLLLGSSGLLGHNVLRRLTEAGHGVVALVRRADAIRMPHEGFDIKVGSLLDSATLTAAAEGCDAIVNCAGVTDMGLLHRSDYAEVNQLLCHALAEVMNHHGIRRMVHTSTVNTIGYGTADRPADEQEPPKEPFAGSYYADTKRCGEDILRECAAMHPDWHIVVVNPGYMLGPMDVKPSSGRMLLAAYRKPVAFAPCGGKAFVDVRDVATAVVNALEMGQNGQRYIAVSSAGCLSIKELYKLQASVMGYRQRVLTVPDWLLRAAGAVGDAVRAAGIRTELSSRNVQMLMVREYYDNRRAINELGLTETPLGESIKTYHQWREQK